MKIKEGARLALTQTPMLFAAHIADSIYRDLGAKDGVVVTSGMDGRHSAGSLHYVGYALDFRTWNLPEPKLVEEAAGALRESLGIDFDVVVEKDHIHCEFQPKKDYS